MKTINTNIPARVAPLLIGAAVVVTGFCEWNALNAKDRRDHPEITLTQAACLKCHSDALMLAKMKAKEGTGSTHALFQNCPSSHTAASNSADSYSAASYSAYRINVQNAGQKTGLK